MGRPKKEGVYINCKIKADIAKTLDLYCNETGLSKTVTIEKALNEYFIKPKVVPLKNTSKSSCQ